MSSCPIVYRPQGLSCEFPGGWDISLQVSCGTWCAKKDTRMFSAQTEQDLFRLVVASERKVIHG